MLRSLTMLVKNVLSFSATFCSSVIISSFSTRVILLDLTVLSERNGLTVFQNFLLFWTTSYLKSGPSPSMKLKIRKCSMKI